MAGGACDRFTPQFYRPYICVHCFNNIAAHDGAWVEEKGEDGRRFYRNEETGRTLVAAAAILEPGSASMGDTNDAWAVYADAKTGAPDVEEPKGEEVVEEVIKEENFGALVEPEDEVGVSADSVPEMGRVESDIIENEAEKVETVSVEKVGDVADVVASATPVEKDDSRGNGEPYILEGRKMAGLMRNSALLRAASANVRDSLDLKKDKELPKEKDLEVAEKDKEVVDLEVVEDTNTTKEDSTTEKLEQRPPERPWSDAILSAATAWVNHPNLSSVAAAAYVFPLLPWDAPSVSLDSAASRWARGGVGIVRLSEVANAQLGSVVLPCAPVDGAVGLSAGAHVVVVTPLTVMLLSLATNDVGVIVWERSIESLQIAAAQDIRLSSTRGRSHTAAASSSPTSAPVSPRRNSTPSGPLRRRASGSSRDLFLPTDSPPNNPTELPSPSASSSSSGPTPVLLSFGPETPRGATCLRAVRCAAGRLIAGTATPTTPTHEEDGVMELDAPWLPSGSWEMAVHPSVRRGRLRKRPLGRWTARFVERTCELREACLSYGTDKEVKGSVGVASSGTVLRIPDGGNRDALPRGLPSGELGRHGAAGPPLPAAPALLLRDVRRWELAWMDSRSEWRGHVWETCDGGEAAAHWIDAIATHCQAAKSQGPADLVVWLATSADASELEAAVEARKAALVISKSWPDEPSPSDHIQDPTPPQSTRRDISSRGGIAPPQSISSPFRSAPPPQSIRRWAYIDDGDQPRGPFPESQMREWLLGHWFHGATLVRCMDPPPDCDREAGQMADRSCIFLPLSTLFADPADAFTDSVAWVPAYNRAARWQLVLSMASDLGCDPALIHAAAATMWKENLPPELSILLDLAGVQNVGVPPPTPPPKIDPDHTDEF